MPTFFIPTFNLSDFEKKFTKLQRIGKKIGCELTCTYGQKMFKKVKQGSENAEGEMVAEEGSVTWAEEQKKIYYLEYQEVTVEGPAPVIAGWEFVGTLEHDYEDAIIRALEGVEVPERYRTAKNTTCEHCGIARFRRDTYLVRNKETGEFKQVGKACLKDFVGHISPEQLAKYLSFVTYPEAGFMDIDEGDPSLYQRLAVNSVRAAGHAVRVLRMFGYISSSTAQVNECRSTAEYLFLSYDGERGVKRENKVFQEPPTDEDYDTGAKALVELRADQREPRNDFEHNLKVIIKAEQIGYRDLGLFAAGIQSWIKAKVAEEKRKAEKAARKPSEFVGTIGERMDTELMPVYHTTFEGAYGVNHLFKLYDKNDNLFTWFGSGEAVKVLGKAMPEGQFIPVRFTVKKQETYKDEKQTVVTRLAIRQEKK